MGKKIKKQDSKAGFQKIIRIFQKGDYREAACLLRQAKFLPKDAPKVNQLNIDIHFFWALDYFIQSDYSQAINTLRMFIERYKKKMKLPLEKADILLGLSYLYLGNWEKGTDYLQASKNQESTRKFYFYYLLCLIYQKKYKDFYVFFEKHQEDIDLLGQNRRQYLEITFAIVVQDLERAKTLLENYEGLSEAHTNNIIALKNILDSSTIVTREEHLKTLYKALLKVSLSETEEKYLALFPQFEDSVVDLKYQRLEKSLIKILEKLCEGQALSDSELIKCLKMPEEHRPHIIYNQVANLYNEGIEENESQIVATIKKHERHFFKVPESLLLFTQIVYWDAENFSSTFFWRSLETGLDYFGETFNDFQFNRLSWSIFGCLQTSGFTVEKVFNKRQFRMAVAYPQMLGLKLWQIIDHAMLPGINLPDSALDVFTFSNFQYGHKMAIKKLEQALGGMFPQRGFFSFMMEDLRELEKAYEQILYRLQNALIRATNEHQVHLKNRVVLDLFKITHRFINKFEREKAITLEKEKIKKFTDAYKNILELFDEIKPASEYFQDYQLLLNAPKRQAIAKLIDSNYDEKILKAQFKSLINEGVTAIINQAFIDKMDSTHFDDYITKPLVVYLKTLVDNSGEHLEASIQQFGKLYVKQLKLPYDCEHPDEVYLQLLGKLATEKPTPNHTQLLGTLANVYLPYMIGTIEPIYYNTIEKLLTYFRKTYKVNPDFNFDQELIQQLMVFTKKVVKTKKLKKLTKSLAETEAIFG